MAVGDLDARCQLRELIQNSNYRLPLKAMGKLALCGGNTFNPFLEYKLITTKSHTPTLEFR